MKQINQDQRIHETAQQLVHGLLDAEAEYAVKINRLAEKWFTMAKEAQLMN